MFGDDDGNCKAPPQERLSFLRLFQLHVAATLDLLADSPPAAAAATAPAISPTQGEKQACMIALD